MEQTGLTVTVESLTELWKRCRLVGLINKMFFYLMMFGLVLSVMIIITHCNDCSSETCQYMCKNADKERSGSEWIYWITYWTIICLLFALLIRFTIVNNYLRSRNMPFDENKVKVWLRYHKVLFVIFVLSFIRMLFQLDSKNTFGVFRFGIICIGLMSELLIVEKFNKALSTISADPPHLP